MIGAWPSVISNAGYHLTADTETAAHTSSFEDAITVIPQSTHTYSVNLSSEWAIGDGGLLGYEQVAEVQH